MAYRIVSFVSWGLEHVFRDSDQNAPSPWREVPLTPREQEMRDRMRQGGVDCDLSDFTLEELAGFTRKLDEIEAAEMANGVDAIMELRRRGWSWRDIEAETGVSQASLRRYARRMHMTTATTALGEVIYYVRVGEFIKIGRTKNFADRMRSLWPEEILAIEYGPGRRESERHTQFSEAHAMRRDYFHPTPELMEHIAELAMIESIPVWLPGMTPGGRPSAPLDKRKLDSGATIARGGGHA